LALLRYALPVYDKEALALVMDGPAWSLAGLDIAAGRYPLSVERHVMRMVDLLVPGVTALTAHARYYGLHGLIAVEAERHRLSAGQAQDLLRRCEVALAAVSFAHDHGDLGLPRAHGVDKLAGRLRNGEVDVAEVSQPGKGHYVENTWGFWRPYASSEVVLGILAPGGSPTPGEACDANVLRAGLGGLLDLARQPRLIVDDLRDHGHLCVCAGAAAADGPWLAGLLCGSADDRRNEASATRRATIQLLTRVMQTHEVRAVTRDVRPVLAFGGFLTSDPVTGALDAAPVWRGVVLRNYAVGAWRRLWSWLVAQVNGLTPAEELGDRFAESLPSGTVAGFARGMPTTMDPSGSPAPAEEQLRGSDMPLPLRELAVLSASARRVDELTGRVRDAFLGQRGVELGPEWMARRLAESGPVALRDFGRRLAADLLARGQRVALSKARRRPDGTLWLPTRLHERGGLLFRTSHEGSGDVGIRLDQLTTVLAGAGVLRLVDGAWRATSQGQVLLA
jgi:hypothetical protein